MKKLLTLALTLALTLSVAGCGGGAAGGVSQDEYDVLKAEYDKATSDYNGIKSELDAANLQLQKAELDNENLLKENEDLKNQLNEAAEGARVDAQGSLADSDSGILVYDDEYVTISYLGCEIDQNKEKMVFYVVNKTDCELSFQANSLAINGESLGHVSGSDTIAAQGKGKIRYTTKETFPTMLPDTITGTLKVIDFSKTLFGKQSYEVSFVSLEVN